MARVTLYTRAGCAHCAKQRAAIVARGDTVSEVDLTREPQAMTEFLKLTGGRRIVPVLVHGGRIEVAPDGGTEF